MLRRIEGILRPAPYHGDLFEPPYFEGWYAKLVDAEARERLAVIVGIFRAVRADQERAFVQLFDGARGQAADIRFPVNDFQASTSRLDVRLDRCRLTDRQLSLDVKRTDVSLSGHVSFDRLSPWPVTPWAPGAMGWYAWVPFMECYHGVVSMDHGVSGTVEWDGRTYRFDHGRGYLEKDWGRAFPSSWIWLQTNHFGAPGTSLMGSIARIPWIRRSFPGFMVGLLHDGRLYRFAVYTGAKTVRLAVSDEHVDWVIRDRRHEIELRAHRGESTILTAPSFHGMDRTMEESLQARVDVRLSRRGWRSGVIYEGTGDPAGLEVQGELTELGAVAR